MTTDNATTAAAPKLAFNFRTHYDHKSNKLVDVTLKTTPDAQYQPWEGRSLGTLMEEEGKGFRLRGDVGPKTKYFEKRTDAARELYDRLKAGIRAEKRRNDLKRPLAESQAGIDWRAYYGQRLRTFDDYGTVLAAFLKRAADGAADAISWEAAKVARAEYKHKLAAEFDRVMTALAHEAGEMPDSKSALEFLRAKIQAKHDERLSSFMSREPWRQGSNLIDTALRQEEAGAERDFIREVLLDLVHTLDWLVGDRDVPPVIV